MVALRPFFRQVQIPFVLFVNFALAALQNVTVDDAVSVGVVVPQYLPVDTYWAPGNNCSGCIAKPNPALAYNGTWHDTTYSPNNSYTQEIEFTFTGSAIYIFFIIANTVPGATTLTDIQFLLDGDVVGTYTHNPTSSTDYEYNVAVYANDSVPLREHDMRVQPVNSGNNVLILFDYLIYTIDNSSTSTVSPSPSATSSSPSTSSQTTDSSSKAVIGGAVGGAVGGVVVLAIVAVVLLCFWRRRMRRDHGPSVEEGAIVDPFVLSREVAPTSLMATAPSSTLAGATLSPTESRQRSFKTGAMLPETATPSSTIPSVPSPPSSSTDPPSSASAAASSHNNALIEQVELLRDEVARLRDLHDSERNMFELEAEAPPEYS